MCVDLFLKALAYIFLGQYEFGTNVADGYFGRIFFMCLSPYSRNCLDMLFWHNWFKFSVAFKVFNSSCNSETRPFPCSLICLLRVSLIRGQSCDVTMNNSTKRLNESRSRARLGKTTSLLAQKDVNADARPVSCSLDRLLGG